MSIFMFMFSLSEVLGIYSLSILKFREFVKLLDFAVIWLAIIKKRLRCLAFTRSVFTMGINS